MRQTIQAAEGSSGLSCCCGSAQVLELERQHRSDPEAPLHTREYSTYVRDFLSYYESSHQSSFNSPNINFIDWPSYGNVSRDTSTIASCHGGTFRSTMPPLLQTVNRNSKHHLHHPTMIERKFRSTSRVDCAIDNVNLACKSPHFEYKKE